MSTSTTRPPWEWSGNSSLPWIAIASVWVVLAGTIYFGTMRLRQGIRTQIANRDAAILHSVALMDQLRPEADLELGSNLEEPADQMAVLLRISQLKGVIAARLFDATGRFVAAFPATVKEGVLSPGDRDRLQRLVPVSHFKSAADPGNEFLGLARQSKALRQEPLLDVFIPLHRREENRLLGVIQFVIDGESIAAEFRALDGRLMFQAGMVFLCASLLSTLGLGWAFRRLQRTSRLLLARTRELATANEELTLAAKTSAVGAIAAHLIHGLSNPLSGLQNFVAGKGEGMPSGWADALSSTSQMQSLVGEIVRILGDERSDQNYEITLHELMETLQTRLEPLTRETGVRFVTEISCEGHLPNRRANLTLLILENLTRNAIQASSPGQAVIGRVAEDHAWLTFEVKDQGSGLTPQMQQALFKPCRSNKVGGNGIGLAICKQLANHLHAELQLQQSGPNGSVFVLMLPQTKPIVA